ncbi:carbohydrate sulfotransferase 9-like [Tiliqua scincoides]|uniref:carbohydrate sulfotransferase 9-like n=1 Tax=Tiliqua scincoides TaxID=71010 RepID=UPI003461FE31
MGGGIRGCQACEYEGQLYMFVNCGQNPERDWLERQSVRRRTLNATCLNDSLSHSVWKLEEEVARQLFVVKSHRLIYCEVPKVGCSNWKRIILLLMLNLSRDASEVDGNIVHRSNHLKKLSSYPLEQQAELLNSYTKVMFTRHPLERLVSAYRDKLLHSEPYYSGTVANEIRHLFRRNKTSTEKVTFQEFVSFVVSRQNKYTDIHWKPQFALCDPCNIHYDILGKYETLEQDAERVLRQIGAPGGLHYPNIKTHSSEKRTNSNITWTYLRKLNRGQMQKLKERYQMDFSLFNYSVDFKNEVLS